MCGFAPRPLARDTRGLPGMGGGSRPFTPPGHPRSARARRTGAPTWPHGRTVAESSRTGAGFRPDAGAALAGAGQVRSPPPPARGRAPAASRNASGNGAAPAFFQRRSTLSPAGSIRVEPLPTSRRPRRSCAGRARAAPSVTRMSRRASSARAAVATPGTASAAGRSGSPGLAAGLPAQVGAAPATGPPASAGRPRRSKRAGEVQHGDAKRRGQSRGKLARQRWRHDTMGQ